MAQQDPRAEGEYLGRMGLLLARAGSFEQAATALARGERLLRDADDRAALAMLLTQAALAAALQGDAALARRRFDEVSARVREDALEPGAEWRRWLHEVQQREDLPPSGAAAAAADQPVTGRS